MTASTIEVAIARKPVRCMRSHSAFMAGLVSALMLAGCAPKNWDSKQRAIPPQPSQAALAYATPSHNTTVASELADLASGGAKGNQMTYYRNVECAAALLGIRSRLQGQIGDNDDRMAAFSQAIRTFQDRAVALGGKAGLERDRVMEEIARTQRVADEREGDTLNRQSQQSLMCLYELS